MSTAIAIYNIVALLGCTIWTGAYLLGTWTVWRTPGLDSARSAHGMDAPLVSVIFAARNEEAAISDALSALAMSAYPSLEIIAVDDRSTDLTGRIIREHAARDPRIKALHIDTLPPGWLGKVHALDLGYRASSGRWIIFTDADVKFLPDTIGRALTLAKQGGHDHFVLLPKLTGASYMLEVAFVAFSILFLMGTKAYSIGRKGSKGFIGVGAFNMVKREAFERTPGFEWLRMEVGDDVGLGLMMKNSRASTGYAFAGMGVHLQWYRTLPEMFAGLSKNMFSTARYSYPRMAAMAIQLVILALSPAAFIAPWAWPWLAPASAACLLAVFVLGLVSRGLFVSRFSPYLLGPLGFAMLPAILLNSAFRCMRRGGIEWRGTLYTTEELKKGQRIRF